MTSARVTSQERRYISIGSSVVTRVECFVRESVLPPLVPTKWEHWESLVDVDLASEVPGSVRVVSPHPRLQSVLRKSQNYYFTLFNFEERSVYYIY